VAKLWPPRGHGSAAVVTHPSPQDERALTDAKVDVGVP
jgi:hypothetical protein